MNKTINIGIVGFGVVGSQTALVLKRKRRIFSLYNGVDYRIKKICEVNWSTKREWMPPQELRTENYMEIINDPDIDIVVELVGKFQPAYEIVKKSLESGKSIVTANKLLLSKKLLDLITVANGHGAYLGFEASVAGAIPVIKGLKESFSANRITSIVGILNGTTNFILSSMTRKKQNFKDALKIAQKLGYAESDPSLDISGRDSAQKLAIISTYAFHCSISDDDFLIEGIDTIGQEDIEFTSELGYRIKLLAIAKRVNDAVSLRVHPALISEGHMLADVEDVYNAVYLEGDLSGRSLLYGEGAGGRAASSAVLADIIEIGKKISSNTHFSEQFTIESRIAIQPIDKIETKYYLRFTALDMPGVLARIAEILGRNRISIASVIQKGENPECAVPIVMLTHKAIEKNVRNAIKEIDKLPCIKKKTQVLRVEE